MKNLQQFNLAALSAVVLVLSGCASMGSHSGYSQASLPVAVQVPAGHKVAMETVGVGQITFECRAKKEMSTEYEWVFVGPDAQLKGRNGVVIGKYWGPPATWESIDGSRVTATQVALAPAGEGNIALQLVKANPVTGMGAMQGVSYIQRVATRGGVIPKVACNATSLGNKEIVPYQADYIFWKAV